MIVECQPAEDGYDLPSLSASSLTITRLDVFWTSIFSFFSVYQSFCIPCQMLGVFTIVTV